VSGHGRISLPHISRRGEDRPNLAHLFGAQVMDGLQPFKKRPKYGASENDVEGPAVIIAPMPDHPIDRCKADVGLLSYIIVSKLAVHLPLYRQNGIFAPEGVDIPRATQTSWTLQVYEAIRPLKEAHKINP
jgi:transposase